MRTIATLWDLEDFGIKVLTGEADNLGFRLLCDLTERGRNLVAETFSIRTTGFHDNWNRGTNDDPHVASVMLSREQWMPIGIIALIQAGELAVLTDKPALFGLDLAVDEFVAAKWDLNKETDEIECVKPYEYRDSRSRQGLRAWPARVYGTIERVFQPSSHPHSGTRNVHHMSERAV